MCSKQIGFKVCGTIVAFNFKISSSFSSLTCVYEIRKVDFSDGSSILLYISVLESARPSSSSLSTVIMRPVLSFKITFSVILLNSFEGVISFLLYKATRWTDGCGLVIA